MEDWNEMEQEYVAGAANYRLLAKKHGLPYKTIAQRGKEGHWVEKRKEYMAQQEQMADVQQVRRAGRLLEVADRLLDRVEELGSEEGVTAASLKTLSETLKNIRDAQIIKNARDQQRGGQECGGITVTLEDKTGEFAA